jgi:hypothetical protein
MTTNPAGANRSLRLLVQRAALHWHQPIACRMLQLRDVLPNAPRELLAAKPAPAGARQGERSQMALDGRLSPAEWLRPDAAALDQPAP